ncbi:hypothetical protein [Vibrio sonorensis]|uniref:hypothetical protein n=1 Tax=Vibrio sonorensis TaxID=1004316 RepID=UPI001FDFE72F|nr:hypothetical protein [Vibrio sonorensis]
MDRLINKIKSLAHSANTNQQKISQFIIDQNFDLSRYSATKVGAELGLSDSSVIRYAKQLGCQASPT